MSLQWTFIATCLYAEIGILIILLLPFISATRWQSLFRSRIVRSLTAYGHIYFNVFIAVLTLLFFDAIRETRKHSVPEEKNLNITAEARMMEQMKLFRAQRNFYIAGFALFLFFVIKRLVNLTSSHATLSAQCIAFQKQAESANDAARRLMEDKENKVNKTKEDESKGSKVGEVVDQAMSENELEKELKQTRYELESAKQDLRHAQMDLDLIKKQAASTNREYDRLLEEHSELQEKLESLENSGGKKDK
ncbi:B-cell receptor-associated protein 31-like isoform X1 [Gigantopelta aegis]|uniref:B-cell receptor-associated protein 31-like isoform X1 n=1 Tax=Gigantopelta aegis TaxID=1735272 RepID=UPI001B888D5B|nr:B-cell receptor-associated protein 31-like isoform X1 [Gigantopelta aegis]XP_041349823.1 B-cell receptor-associated protein 31-like isoform X1 [Gigantopelta aegis]